MNDNNMGIYLLIDFGSTYTKVFAIETNNEEILGWAQSPTTIEQDIMIGFNDALQNLFEENQKIKEKEITEKIACSSAAGGLRLISIGLVPELTVKAACQAALGAGAKVIKSYSYELSSEAVKEIETVPHDIILLAGGTDGGDKEVILNNSKMLSRSKIDVPIIIAGNRVVSGKARDILCSGGKYAEITENVLPELEVLNVEPVRSKIREIFTKRIVRAKGLGKAEKYVGKIIMPTPMATLKAAKLLADGTSEEQGIGELLLVEVGGATTNIHSVAKGNPTTSQVITRGLPEPYEKRTVEGDLGIRYNANTILALGGEECLMQNLKTLDPMEGGKENIDLAFEVDKLHKKVSFIPEKEIDFKLDAALTRTAVEIAVERHAGILKEQASISGTIMVQYGKDLTGVKNLIGTGGIFRHGNYFDKIFQGALFNMNKPWYLKPRAPRFYLDSNYILYGIGLLSGVLPTKAVRIAKKYLIEFC